MRISHLTAAEPVFRKRLKSARDTCTDIEWYPYDSLSNVSHLDVLLPGSVEVVPDHGSVLDVGCADGDMGFLFDSMGCQVDFLDNPATNFNGCKGVMGSAKLLRHTGRILQHDIDFGFELDRDYDLVLFLGTLYHLRNPALALLRLAEHCEQMLLSTRVIRHLPKAGAALSDAPVAYLVDTFELNNDPTNWWLLSPAGLLRILKRCGWTTLASRLFVDTSGRIDGEPDERMFVHCRHVSNYRDLSKHHHY